MMINGINHYKYLFENRLGQKIIESVSTMNRFLKSTMIVPFGLLIFVVVLSVNCASQKKVDSKEAHKDKKTVEETEPANTKTVQTENAIREDVEPSEEMAPTNEKSALEGIKKELDESLAGFNEALLKKEASTKQEGSGSFTGNAPAGVTQDELGNLTKELDKSLIEFDDMLLKEKNEIQERKQSKINGTGENGAAASQKTGDKGTSAGSSSGKTNSGGNARRETAGEGHEGEVSHEEGHGTSSGAGSQGDMAGTGGSSASGTQGRPTYGSAQDDDVVARQIREAAEKETDPVLKEKLWKEYEEYKKGKSGNE